MKNNRRNRELKIPSAALSSGLLCAPSSLLFALGALLFALCSSAEAQQAGRIARVGILFIGGRDQPHLESFKQGLKERGYTEGKNILLDYRYAEGNVDRLPSLAAELVQLKVDVIVTTSGNSARAARSEEHTSELQSRFGISYAVF